MSQAAGTTDGNCRSVETQAVARRLTTLGCDFAQGYLTSKPLPGEQFAAWFANYRPLRFNA